MMRAWLSAASGDHGAGTQFAVSDAIANADIDHATPHDLQQWTGCTAGALTHQDYAHALQAAGFLDIEITTTHRVHPHAASAIVRARTRSAYHRGCLDGDQTRPCSVIR